MKTGFPLTSLLIFLIVSAASGQTFIADMKRESARSDKLTGGTIQKTALQPGDASIKITVNVPAFQMTLWQDGKEIKSYPIGLGLIDYPVSASLRKATSIEWNPVWIPPSSEWIEKSSKVKPGEKVLPTDPRNPLGKVKIPLGYGYLIHQAKGPADLGSLVSHGCIRVMQRDLYDLTESIAADRSLDVTAAQIAAAKRNRKTLIARLDPIVPVEITYDTLVVEAGRLHIYPDVYGHEKNTVENLRTELETSGVDVSDLSDQVLRKMLGLAKGKRQFVVNVADIDAGKALQKGKIIPVISVPPATGQNRRR